MSLLDKTLTLNLNALWQPLKFVSGRKSFEDLCSINKDTGSYAHLAMDLTYAQHEDGTYDTTNLLSATPVNIEQWLLLPVRACDIGVMCSRRLIRLPTITISANFDKLNDRMPKFSAAAVRQRDKDTCQITGRKLALGEGDLGHDLARAKGGRRTFTNIAYIDKKLNRLMGTKSFAEMGWGHVKPKAPKKTKVFITRAEAKHPDHLHFLAD